jgi:Fur family ferric uptake transcriptional regulator
VSTEIHYTTQQLLLDCAFSPGHQFGQNQAHYEKIILDKQHDHSIMTDGREVIEFVIREYKVH